MSNYAIFYHADTTATAVSFDTTRKGAAIAAQLQKQGLVVQSPQPLTDSEARAVHAAEYITAIQTGTPRTLATSQGFAWDVAMWRSVAAQNGAMRDATLAALAGTPAYAISAGFHHARHGHGSGYCTLNGLAIAVHVARTHGVKHIYILDVDAHAGGGTYSMVHTYTDVCHLDVYTTSFDTYSPTSQHRLTYTVDAATYLADIDDMLTVAARTVQPGDLLIYNAGMDPYEACGIGGLEGITVAVLAQREQLISAWARLHHVCMVACLAGGYAGDTFPESQLVDLHCTSVHTFLHHTVIYS